MADDVHGPDIEERVAVFLEVTGPHWACRPCIARTMEMSMREVKIALLRFAFGRKDYIETASEVCDGCGAKTAVVRLSQRGRLRLIA